MSGTGNGIFRHTSLWGEEAGDKISLIVACGGDHSERIKLTEKPHVGLERSHIGRSGEHSQIVARFQNLHGLTA